jgi:hypothetical protein
LITKSESSNSKIIVLKACGWRRFLNGISNRYDDNYPSQLYNVISQGEFSRIMNSLHNRIISHWPCDTCCK